MTTETYDFIIVGAGPSGATLASRLANSRARPSVLLIEAGSTDGKDELSRVAIDRFFYFAGEHARPAVLPYETVPQLHLNSQKIPYTRGRGLGGTAAINFSMWTIPPRHWHEEIAERTGNAEWSWKKAQQRYKRLEAADLDQKLPDDAAEYLAPSPDDHGTNGAIKVGFPQVFESSLRPEMEAWKGQNGLVINKDSNNGESIGLSLVWNSIRDGYRSTAADILPNEPSLTIIRDAHVAKVIFKNLVATGIVTIDGRIFNASKEVILSAGSLDTPKILMLSGIGPADQLAAFNIPLLVEYSNVGNNLQDHYHAAFVLVRTPSSLKSTRSEFYRSKELQSAALEQWKEDRSGPLSEIGGVMGVILQRLKSVDDSAEVQALEEPAKSFVLNPSIPAFEIMLNGPNFGHLMAPDKLPPSQAYVIMLTSPQSRGTATLQSADPSVPLLFDPCLFSHPYDQRVALESTRYLVNVLEKEPYSKDTLGKIRWPTGFSDDEVLEYWRQNARSTWHMSGTVRMGQHPRDSCVDGEFKVWGVERLRVADLSVLPLLPPSHPQTLAYMIGLMLGDQLVQEYHLDD